MSIPVFFAPQQLTHRPGFEWMRGERILNPEAPERAEAILKALEKSSRFSLRAPTTIPLQEISRLHDPALLRALATAERELGPEAEVIPSTFPSGRERRADPDNLRHLGAFVNDTGTPFTRHTLAAAQWSAAAAHAAALQVRDHGERLTYALSRPPGHHASGTHFGGYCYFNNAALAARTLPGRVALLDIDFHHGNGTQEVFWEDDRVFFASIHGDPRTCYPFHWGHPDERGGGRGKGFNLNVPLPLGADGAAYLEALDTRVLPQLRAFAPQSLVLSAGLDTFVGDPMGGFTLTREDLHQVGVRVGLLGLPTVVIQEGGYLMAELGANAVALLEGVAEGLALAG